MSKITAPGIYDIPEAEYHADPVVEPSLSRSIAKTMLRKSPAHAREEHPRLNPDFEPENGRHDFDLGNAAHKLVLGKGRDLAFIDAKGYQTKAAKEAREAAYEDGKIPALPHQVGAAQRMARAARTQIDSIPEFAGLFMRGNAERTIVWNPTPDTWARTRPDLLIHNADFKTSLIVDYKTTTDARPDRWVKRMDEHGLDLQAAMHIEAVRTALNVERPDFRFIVQETSPPYALAIIAPKPRVIEIGMEKFARAVEMWRWCMQEGTWPGYAALAHYVDLPGWAEAQWEDEKAHLTYAREQTGKDFLAECIRMEVETVG
ncbi:MAG: PD-(D/E)XK nuclease-like domain-containing protein [Alphaproteobacteria bacterium]|nr:PD-(D/E)XK nuclease-like domain-containing protein [Alphaproteobacteria bacterium]